MAVTTFGKAPTITSLEDITSMEDVTSLLDLKLDDKLYSVAASPDYVQDFRRTVKAMSTQVTPQSSPLSMFYMTRREEIS